MAMRARAFASENRKTRHRGVNRGRCLRSRTPPAWFLGHGFALLVVMCFDRGIVCFAEVTAVLAAAGGYILMVRNAVAVVVIVVKYRSAKWSTKLLQLPVKTVSAIRPRVLSVQRLLKTLD